LEALAHPAACPELAGEEPDDDTAVDIPAMGSVDEVFALAQVDEQGDGGMRDHRNVHGCRGTVAEPGHADPRQPI
jgi:hypothetical protein